MGGAIAPIATPVDPRLFGRVEALYNTTLVKL